MDRNKEVKIFICLILLMIVTLAFVGYFNYQAINERADAFELCLESCNIQVVNGMCVYSELQTNLTTIIN